VDMARRAPPLPHAAWPGDAVALVGLLIVANAMRGQAFGEEHVTYVRHVLAGVCLAAALLEVARLLQLAFAARCVPVVAAVAATPPGLALCAQGAVAVAAAAAALGAVYSGTAKS